MRRSQGKALFQVQEASFLPNNGTYFEWVYFGLAELLFCVNYRLAHLNLDLDWHQWTTRDYCNPRRTHILVWRVE